MVKDYSFKTNEFIVLFSGVLFLCIKYVVDVNKWYIEDFCKVCGMDPNVMKRMELFVLDQAINYKMFISDDEFSDHHAKIYKYVKKRVAANKNNISQLNT